jgi:predicted TIM-barrel fold metal-dependent hydrolase
MIIDTHQHFWHVGKPWAKATEDYKILAEPEGITGTILRLEENQDAVDLAAVEPFIVGICGSIKPGPDFDAELGKYSANPMFRGISLIGREFENVKKGNFLACMEKLAAKDLELDLLRVLPGFYGGPKAMQMAYKGTQESLNGMFTIAESVPSLRMVVQHVGGMPIDGRPIKKEWRDVFEKIAKHPQISIKISGLMERVVDRPDSERPTEALSFYRPTLDAIWEIFGEDRLMYGSNWPVSEHAGDFVANGLRIVRRYFAEKGEEPYRKYFWKNSQKVYKWVPRLPSQADHPLAAASGGHS